jgi:hypothetical protein
MPKSVPQHDAVPHGEDLAAIKTRARAAWLEVKVKAPNLVPPALADRLWASALSSIDGAPPRVRAVMLHRVETMFKLLTVKALPVASGERVWGRQVFFRCAHRRAG